MSCKLIAPDKEVEERVGDGGGGGRGRDGGQRVEEWA